MFCRWFYSPLCPLLLFYLASHYGQCSRSCRSECITCFRPRMDLCLGLYQLCFNVSMTVPFYFTQGSHLFFRFIFWIDFSSSRWVTFTAGLVHKFFYSLPLALTPDLVFYSAPYVLLLVHFLLFYKVRIHPIPEYCSHMLSGISSTAPPLLDRFQRMAIRLISDPSLTSSLRSFVHLRVFAFFRLLPSL